MTKQIKFCLSGVKNIPANDFHLFSRGFWAPGVSDKCVSELLQGYEVDVKLSEKVSANICLV